MCWKLTTKFNFPHSINNEHVSFILFIHVIVFPPKAQLHFLHINPHTTHKSSNHPDKGPTLETLAFKHFTVANVHFQLSCEHQITLLYSPTHTAPQFLQKLTSFTRNYNFVVSTQLITCIGHRKRVSKGDSRLVLPPLMQHYSFFYLETCPCNSQKRHASHLTTVI